MTRRRRLRVGVIGAGAWARQSHLPTLASRSEDVELWAVARRDGPAVERIKEEFGFRYAFTDYRELTESGIDVCIVASPAARHFEHARAALECGAHVLVEKPFTVEPGEAWALVDIASRGSRHLLVSYGYHYRPLPVAARALFDTWADQPIEFLAVTMGSAVRGLLRGQTVGQTKTRHTGWKAETYVDPALSGGGYGQTQLTHAIGLALWLTGLRAVEVSAYAWPPPSDSLIELHLAIAVSFSGGAVGVIGGGAAHRGGGNARHHLALRATGARGQIELDFETNRLEYVDERGSGSLIDLAADAGRYDDEGPVHALIDLALGNVGENRSPGEVGARTVELLSAAYESSRSHHPVRVQDTVERSPSVVHTSSKTAGGDAA